MNPGETIILSDGKYSLVKSLCHLIPFCWFVAGPERYDAKPFVAAHRDDRLIYLAGFRTKDAALDYGLKNGFTEI